MKQITTHIFNNNSSNKKHPIYIIIVIFLLLFVFLVKNNTTLPVKVAKVASYGMTTMLNQRTEDAK